MSYPNAKPRSSWRKQSTTYRSSSSTNNTARSTQHIARKKLRGALKPLLSEAEKQNGNIQVLSYDFACRITRLYQYLTEDSQYKEYIISKQVFRSGTSIAANTSEAQHAQSKQDFLAKRSIASKESNESAFWLNLLHDNGYLEDIAFNSIYADCIRVRNKIRAITKSTQDSLKSSK